MDEGLNPRLSADFQLFKTRGVTSGNLEALLKRIATISLGLSILNQRCAIRTEVVTESVTTDKVYTIINRTR